MQALSVSSEVIEKSVTTTATAPTLTFATAATPAEISPGLKVDRLTFWACNSREMC
jgi:hypothetical protein